ncbi:hypothetical protein Glove_33g17 [Diversispora epigaea]|uniref:Uncharacterized protein n=1 Tax=Diversispora epigaea TaxID=1348612 RepID=A0A397JGY1_9GLOM|nr:hypothetical protein Glove_33g17 [Diversispora epigaea]
MIYNKNSTVLPSTSLPTATTLILQLKILHTTNDTTVHTETTTTGTTADIITTDTTTTITTDTKTTDSTTDTTTTFSLNTTYLTTGLTDRTSKTVHTVTTFHTTTMIIYPQFIGRVTAEAVITIVGDATATPSNACDSINNIWKDKLNHMIIFCRRLVLLLFT